MDYSDYFNSIGYKYSIGYHKIIVKDFQRHVFPGRSKEWDGIIGPHTKAKIVIYNRDNFCPEVFEPIKPYIQYTDKQIEGLMKPTLIGYGPIFNFYSRINNFDVLHNIAHSVLEASANGKWANSSIARKKNNIYGFGAYDLSPMASAKKFSDIVECIMIWSKWWNEKYLIPTGKYYHGNCEQGVNVKYATSPIAGINKAFIVRTLRSSLSCL